MRRLLLVSLAVFAVALMMPQPARAWNAGVGLSLGEGVWFVDGTAYRGPFSLEITPSFGWEWLKLDVGLFAPLENLRSSERHHVHFTHLDFILRPGLRLTPPMIPLYLRAAWQMRATNGFDYGLLLGLGVEFSILWAPLSVFGEVDTSFTRDGGWSEVVPLDFRLGLRLTF